MNQASFEQLGHFIYFEYYFLFRDLCTSKMTGRLLVNLLPVERNWVVAALVSATEEFIIMEKRLDIIDLFIFCHVLYIILIVLNLTSQI